MDQRPRGKLIVDIAWRRRWWFFVATAAGLVGSVFVARSLPTVYRASTTILVMGQSVPEDIVHSTVTTRVEERVRSLKIEIKSRRYLDQVVKEFRTAPPNASEGELEYACARLSSRVDLDWDEQGLSWFCITVDDGSAKRAADIANRLGELFLERNSARREDQAKGAVETVEGWLEKTETELRQRDAELARYGKVLAALDRKAKNLYEQPDQRPTTMQLLNAAQARIEKLTGDIQTRSERLATAREEDEALRTAAEALRAPAASDDLANRAFERLQRELQDLLTEYSAEHPLVARKRERIAQFCASHPGLTRPPSGDRKSSTPGSPEIERLQGEIRGLEADREREQRSVDTLRRRIENMPPRQQTLAALTRDYETLQHQYDARFARKEHSKRAQDIEPAKLGEQFQIRDRARPPVTPSAPNVPQIVLFGLLGGLSLGVGFAWLLEFVDHTVRNEEEFSHRYPDLPILGSIPNLDADTNAQGSLLRRYGRLKTTTSVLFLAAASASLALVARGPLA